MLGLLLLIGTTISIFLVNKYMDVTEKVPEKYATWSGLGLDKWASIWLVDKYLVKNDHVRIIPEFGRIKGYEHFDIPGSKYLRDTKETTFQKILAKKIPHNESLSELAEVVHDVEVNLWLPDKNLSSSYVEIAFRKMQEKFGRNSVPYKCYMEFFDTVFDHLASPQSMEAGKGSKTELYEPSNSCEVIDDVNARENVPVVAITELLKAMALGRKVIFVDVRESEEYAEVHIPGAINLQIRNLNEAAILEFYEADLVVSYCVKDFRGFEMAQSLSVLGVKGSVLLNPYGIKGWLSLGLPVFRQGQVSENRAKEELLNLLSDITAGTGQ